MTKTEQLAIRNVIARLKEKHCGCSPDTTFSPMTAEIVKLSEMLRESDASHSRAVEIVSRIYLNTWIIPALELLLDGPDRDPQIAADLAER